jgi:uncharacterized DUF497 family protein
MALRFSWNSEKARRNVRKHGVSFEEAATVFGDRLSLTVHDEAHSSPEEDRFISVGLSHSGRLLVVVHCQRGRTMRIISARQATRAERKAYEEG